MRLISLILLFVFSLNIAFANVDFPQWVLIHYERLGVKTTASLKEIEEVYHQRVQALRSYKREGNVFELVFKSKEEEKLLESAFQAIAKFHKDTQPLLNIEQHFQFLSFSDRWFKEVTPTDPESYLEINWREIEPKLSSAFSSTIEEPMDFGFDMGMGRPMRVNPKLARPGNHYMAYDEIKRQRYLFAKESPTIEQIDLFREVVLLQIHAKKAFSYERVRKILEVNSNDGREFLEKALIILMENKSEFKNKDQLFEKEFRKYLLMAKSSRVSEFLDETFPIFEAMTILRSHLMMDDTTPLIYQAFHDRILYLASSQDNIIRSKVWATILQNKIPLDYDSDPKFGYMYMGMLSQHAKKVKTDKELHFFEAVAWRLSKEIRSIVDNNYTEISYKKLREIEEINKKAQLRLSLLGHIDNVSIDSLFKIATNDSLDFLLSTIDNLIVKSCNDVYKEIL